MTTHADTASAVAAIARILRTPPSPDPDVTAAHILTALRGQGWRPTNAIPLPQWQPGRQGPPLPEDRMHAIAARAREAIRKEDP